MNIAFPPAKVTLSELYQAMKQLQADNPPVQRVALVKPARFMQRRASVYAAQFKIRIQQRAHEGSLYIRRVL